MNCSQLLERRPTNWKKSAAPEGEDLRSAFEDSQRWSAVRIGFERQRLSSRTASSWVAPSFKTSSN
jgi:hypothetical protein